MALCRRTVLYRVTKFSTIRRASSRPEVARNPPVVLVHLAVALAPVVVLAPHDSQPSHQPRRGGLRLLGPFPHEVHHRVAHVRLHPGSLQPSPRLFFSATCSSSSSAITSSFFASLAVSAALRSSSFRSRPSGRRPVLEELLLPVRLHTNRSCRARYAAHS